MFLQWPIEKNHKEAWLSQLDQSGAGKTSLHSPDLLNEVSQDKNVIIEPTTNQRPIYIHVYSLVYSLEPQENITVYI